MTSAINSSFMATNVSPLPTLPEKSLPAKIEAYLNVLREYPYYIDDSVVRMVINDTVLWCMQIQENPVEQQKSSTIALKEWLEDVLLVVELEGDAAKEELDTRLVDLDKIGPKNALAILSHGYWLALACNNQAVATEFEQRLYAHISAHPILLDTPFNEGQLYIDQAEINPEFMQTLEATSKRGNSDNRIKNVKPQDYQHTSSKSLNDWEIEKAEYYLPLAVLFAMDAMRWCHTLEQVSKGNP